MSASDPKSKAQLEALARKEADGEHLSSNEKWELDQAVKYGVGKVKNIRHGGD